MVLLYTFGALIGYFVIFILTALFLFKAKIMYVDSVNEAVYLAAFWPGTLPVALICFIFTWVIILGEKIVNHILKRSDGKHLR